MADPKDLSTSDFWNSRYQEDKAAWDLGQAPDWLEDIAKQLPSPQKVLVLGCGHGHDARCFASAGHEVTAVDFAPLALKAAKAATPPELKINWVLGDVFHLGQGPFAWMQQHFDLVWEQTCLCAIDPARRSEYFASLTKVLAPKGQWLAVLWSHHEEGGPPFHLDPDMVQAMVPPQLTRRTHTPLLDRHPQRSEQHLVRYGWAPT